MTQRNNIRRINALTWCRFWLLAVVVPALLAAPAFGRGFLRHGHDNLASHVHEVVVTPLDGVRADHDAWHDSLDHSPVAFQALPDAAQLPGYQPDPGELLVVLPAFTATGTAQPVSVAKPAVHVLASFLLTLTLPERLQVDARHAHADQLDAPSTPRSHLTGILRSNHALLI